MRLFEYYFLTDTRRTVSKVNKLLINSYVSDRIYKLNKARKIIVKWYERNQLDIIMVDDGLNAWIYNAIKNMYRYYLHDETDKLNTSIENFLYRVAVIEEYFDKSEE
ncbi:hypothetical protein U5M32_05955 [Streptococcus sp. TATVAM-FAB35]|uniref:hypothetical protein n=1 Tax=Streptococcus TaxID=1301 RepID=UPI003980469F